MPSLMAWLIVYPVAAFGVAALLIVCGRWRRRKLPVAVGVAWLCYGAYESLMYTRVLCGGECNIRVDLLLIHPVLAIATLAALVAVALPRRGA